MYSRQNIENCSANSEFSFPCIIYISQSRYIYFKSEFDFILPSSLRSPVNPFWWPNRENSFSATTNVMGFSLWLIGDFLSLKIKHFVNMNKSEDSSEKDSSSSVGCFKIHG